MAATSTTTPGSSADAISWDLSDLYSGPDDAALTKDLDSALERARAFETAYRGKILSDKGPPALLLEAALVELESLSEQMDKPAIYAQLLHAGKTDDPKHGALVARTREAGTVINKHLIFFDLEWVKVPAAAANRLIADPALARFRHVLEVKRAWLPHYLTEPEEKILEEKSITGKAAFVRLFDETVSSIPFPFEHNGKTDQVSLQQLNAKLYDADRSVRQAAATGLTRGLQDNARVLTYIFNTLVQDHTSDCGLRKFDDPMGPRHLANEVQPAVVEALMTATERNNQTVARYYKLKKKLLGLDKLYDYDRYAPISAELPECDWNQARKIVEDSYTAFSPKAGAIIKEFFDRRWIDAALRKGKRGGAFSASAVPSAHPYILMNYSDRLRDVMTLAHELGHGLHQYLSRQVGYLQCHTPLTTAETASVFGEMLTFQQLQKVYPQRGTRLALLCGKIEDGFATVFRQVVLTRFEQSLHKAPREKGEQTTEDLNTLWLEANRPMFGDSVELTPGYGWWWLYISHFIHSPFYCYAYAFGELLVLALVQKHRQEGASFVPRYLELLASGGSDAPHVLLAKLGVDVTDPGFWELGLKLLGDMVQEAEELASK